MAAIAKGLTLYAACSAMNEIYRRMHMRECWDWTSLVPGIGYLKYGASSAPLVLLKGIYGYAAGDERMMGDAKNLPWQIVPPFGGEQMRKSLDGALVAFKGNDTADKVADAVGHKEKKYHIDTPYDDLMAIMFGPGSTPQAREYYDKREKSLYERVMSEGRKSTGPAIRRGMPSRGAISRGTISRSIPTRGGVQ